MKPLTLIKIGGSLITDKSKPFTVREQALVTIAREVKKATETGQSIILGHGAGSFGHTVAKQHQTHKGITNKQGLEGLVEVALAARQLNFLVLQALRAEGVLAMALSPASMMTSTNHSLASLYTSPIEQALEAGLLPVVYGDVILDTAVGCSIFSTEVVLGHIGLALKAAGHPVERIIHCGETNGVYDSAGNTIPLITSENFTSLKAVLGGSSGTDVTGGMLHKVEETLELAKQGIPGLIIDGIEQGSLSQVMAGKEVVGTKIKA